MFEPKKMFAVQDVYGHGKKISWIQGELEGFLRKKKVSKEEIEILDIGCGTGLWVSLPIASLGYRVTGIDPDEASIKLGRDFNAYRNCILENVFLDDIKSKFDVIIISEVLEHIEKPADFLKMARGVLNDDGLALLTVPNGYGFFEMESFLWRAGIGKLLERFLKTRFAPRQPEEEAVASSLDVETSHVNHFTIRRLRKLFRESSFDPKGIRGATLISGPISGTLLNNQKWFLRINAKIVDFLPLWMASDWYIALDADGQKLLREHEKTTL